MTEEQVKAESESLPPPGNPGAIEARLDLVLRELRMLRKELRRARSETPGLPKSSSSQPQPKQVTHG